MQTGESVYVEWRTVALIGFCYAAWFWLTLSGDMVPTAIWVVVFAVITTLHLSIIHEVVHGHPTSNRIVNRLLVVLPISWIFPFERFRDTHLQHHATGELTDPLDDPESWYIYAIEWQRLGPVLKTLLTFNNTLAGRMLIGPFITFIRFFAGEIRTFIEQRDHRIYLSCVWFVHIALCMLLMGFISEYGSKHAGAYFLAFYLAISLLLIRTFLEHQAVENQMERTVIIEQSCPMAFLFLFNNLHALHHARPGIPWYRLPATYRENREALRNSNNHYVYRSYAEVIGRYFFRPKEPVCYPLARRSSQS